MLTAQQVAQFRADGFLNGGKVLSDAEVDVLRDEMARVMDNHGKGGRQPVQLNSWNSPDGGVIWQIVNIWEASDPFMALLFKRPVVEAIAQLLQPRELRVWHDQVQYKPAGKGGFNRWHQDSPCWSALLPKNQQTTAWFALDDVDGDNGCMSMIPGSHQWGVQIDTLYALKDFNSLPAEFQGHAIKVQACPVKKGEVHFHHPLTWHGSHANTSDRPRRAIALHYMTEQTYFVAAATNQHPMEPHIHVADGEKIQGDHFPLVWNQTPHWLGTQLS
jgi:ectoine hydroxylase-related dioxygenase (phytanoyl-CoA dioxygenase family)